MKFLVLFGFLCAVVAATVAESAISIAVATPDEPDCPATPTYGGYPWQGQQWNGFWPWARQQWGGYFPRWGGYFPQWRSYFPQWNPWFYQQGFYPGAGYPWYNGAGAAAGASAGAAAGSGAGAA